MNDIYNHYVRTSHVTFDVEPTSAEQRRRWLQLHENGRHCALVVDIEGRVRGFAASGPYRTRPAYDTTVAASVYVAPNFVGRGIGTDLYAALFATLEATAVHRVVAGIALPNETSVALHRRFEFRRAAHFSEQGRKFDRYWDVDWYERGLASDG